MHKLKMKATRGLTFEEGCNKYLEYCRQRNLRQGTINHYNDYVDVETWQSLISTANSLNSQTITKGN